jgi:radical SAM protein with 4Fe4S-binding SPASM domain
LAIRKYYDKTYRFLEFFDDKTGAYIRTGVLDKDLKDTNVDPFMREQPALLDIGIMGHCENASRCTIGCYQGAKVTGDNMTLENYKSIINQVEGKVFQVALGGAGSPNEHPQFKEILEYTVAHNIIPNYTTSGIGVTKEIAELTRQFCGACAVSEYSQPYTYEAIRLFLEAGCKTNIHYVISNASIDEATKRLEENNFPKGVNAVIFLLYKPVGCGTEDMVLSPLDPRLDRFFKAVIKEHPFKVGFDSCSIPGLLNFAEGIDLGSVDTCEGGRFSGYIHADMTMVPCSFDQKRKWGVSLLNHTIAEAWNSDAFNSFRTKMSSACPTCDKKPACMGGCPILPSIVLCNSKNGRVI